MPTPVQIITDTTPVRDKYLTVKDDGMVVTLGLLHITGHHAKLQLAAQCSGLCGLGQTLLATERHGVWTVKGETGRAWIS